MEKKAIINSRIFKFPKNNRTDTFLAQSKINLQSFKTTPDGLKRSLGAPELLRKRNQDNHSPRTGLLYP